MQFILSIDPLKIILPDELTTSLQQRNSTEPTKVSSEQCSQRHLKQAKGGYSVCITNNLSVGIEKIRLTMNRRSQFSRIWLQGLQELVHQHRLLLRSYLSLCRYISKWFISVRANLAFCEPPLFPECPISALSSPLSKGFGKDSTLAVETLEEISSSGI